MRSPTQQQAAGLLRHPVLLLALATLILNDHWGKAAFPGFATGKLSDVAGLIVAPVVLLAAGEIGAWALNRPLPDRRRWMLGTSIAVGLVFAAVQLLPIATDLYAEAAGQTARWAGALVPGFTAGPGPADVVADPSDLLALPALVAPLWLAGWRFGRHASPAVLDARVAQPAV